MRIQTWLSAGAATALIGAAATGPALASPGQSVTDLTTTSLESLVSSLVGDDTPISNISYTGADHASGLFSGFGSLGIESGVVLTSGVADEHEYPVGEDETERVLSALYGPNEDDGTSGPNDLPGDPDLDAIVDGQTYDASVLEFDFVPTSDRIAFNYIFGSEEYQEYVDSSFNDVFAFFVNGVNHATFTDDDGQEQPVSINSINHLRNTDLYRDNAPGSGALDTGLDGLTTVLGFDAEVNQGETNHIKLVIADRADTILDSAVLIEGGSFRSNTAPIAHDQEFFTLVDTPVDITLTAEDAENDELSYEIVTEEIENGTLTGAGDSYTFTPDEGFLGTTSFEFIANDNSLTSEPATVTINVVEELPTEEPTPSETPTATDTPTPSESPEPSETPSSETPAPGGSGSPSPDGSDQAPSGDQDDDPGALPRTGTDTGTLLAVGAAVIAAGLGLLLLSRKRRTQY